MISKVDKVIGDTETKEPVIEKIHCRVLDWGAQFTSTITTVSYLHWVYYGGQQQWVAPSLKEPMHQGKPPQQGREVAQFRVCENPFSVQNI